MTKRKALATDQEIYEYMKQADNPCNLTTSEFRNLTPELVIMIRSGCTVKDQAAGKTANGWGLKGRGERRRPVIYDFSAGYNEATIKRDAPPPLPKLPKPKKPKAKKATKGKPKTTKAKPPALPPVPGKPKTTKKTTKGKAKTTKKTTKPKTTKVKPPALPPVPPPLPPVPGK